MLFLIKSALRETLSSNEAVSGSPGSTSKCYWPWRGVVPPHSAAISMNALAADIVPFLTTRAATRHCPKCQAGARDRWLEKRRQELLPTCYVHVVFTLPRELAPLALQNKFHVGVFADVGSASVPSQSNKYL